MKTRQLGMASLRELLTHLLKRCNNSRTNQDDSPNTERMVKKYIKKLYMAFKDDSLVRFHSTYRTTTGTPTSRFFESHQ